MGKNIRRMALLLAMVMLLSVLAVPAWAAEGTEDGPVSSFEETVLVDNDDFSLIVEEYDPAGSRGPTFSVALENKSERPLEFVLDDIAVDDMLTDNYWSEEVSAGKKAYSKIEFRNADLDEVGINYIESVRARLWVYDSEDYTADDLYDDEVSWSVTVTGTDEPPLELIDFDNGFEPFILLYGLDMAVMDFDPDGEYGPQLTLLMENRLDKAVSVYMDDVAVNGVMCAPYYSETIPAGTMAYGMCWWYPEDLEDAKIEDFETLEFSMEISDSETYETLAQFTAEIDLTGSGELVSREGDEEIPLPENEYEGYLGDTMRSAFFDFTVNDAWLCEKYESYEPSEGNVLLVVDVTVYNYTATSVPMFDTDFQVAWDEGDEDFAVPITTARDGYPNTGVEAEGNMLPEEYSVGIHKSRQGELVFEVPEGFEDYAFSYLEVYNDDSTGETFVVYFTPDQR